MTDLDALKALEQAATPAPWDEPHMVQPNMAGRHQWWIKAPGPSGLHATGRDEDVHLVVAMRNALPALLDELAAVTADRDGYRQMFGKLVAYVLDAYHQTENDSTELAWELTDLLANGKPLDEWVREQLTARGVNVDEITAS